MKKIILFLLLLLLPLQFVFACGRFGIYELTKYDEKGDFECKFNDNSGITTIEDKLYPNIEIYENNILLSPSIYKDGDKAAYYIGEKYSSDFFPPKFNISVVQNGTEIYSAKWRIKDVTFSMPEKLSPFLLIISLFFTALFFGIFLAGIFLNRFHKIKWFLVGAILIDFISLFFFFSSNC
jgi:hypothetical protein